ncbi:integrase, catalytic region, zinc finger, CCHC-type containing protein [Tanacetum coccineum]|uniref:Integrase, catalytic region, zinc finger, CCHC-type containing protein n=1 Tax=Tanacetum coccineum TaxID=301880 RepID=A0ABQ5J3R4_9ASTR
MLRRKVGEALRRKGCDDSFLRWNMLQRNPSGVLRRKLPRTLHFCAFHVQIPFLLLKCSLADISLRDLRSCFAVTPRRIPFKGSLRDNLDPLNLNDDLNIWKALEKCHIQEDVQHPPGAFLGTVRFENDHVAAILDLEVAFRRNTSFVRNLEGVDMLKGNRTTNLYTINLYEMASASPVCLMARATSTKSWLWHQRLSHLNFDTLNDLAKNNLVIGLPKFKYHKEHLCPSCEQGKSKRASHPPKPVPNSKALCYPKNDREDIGKLGAKGDIGFFIGYSTDSCAYKVYNRRTKKIMETMNVTFNELSAMTFEQSSSKPRLQSMTSGQISSVLDLTYAPSTITNQKPTERELDLLFEAMHDDYVGGQPSAAPRTGPTA